MLERLLAEPPHGLPQPAKEPLLLEGLNELGAHHYASCEGYRRIVDGIWHGRATADAVEDLPYLPVSLFKTRELRSVTASEVRVTLTSSGTTGQTPSRILVDAETSKRQQRGLASSLTHVLGPKRLPMLIVDTSAVLRDPKQMSARGAGVLGLMRYGRDHCFALREDLSVDRDAIAAFLDRVGGQRFAIFGFTFMIWQHLHLGFEGSRLDLGGGVLIHSGGWKKLAEIAVDNAVFRARLHAAFGLAEIFNFYGMVEQLGSIFLEGPDGLLFPPAFTDVVIRDPESWDALPPGREGVIQLVSLIPRSYPGHSLLTEDRGVVEAVDPPRTAPDGRLWQGKGLRILGRVAKAELRGCSDVLAQNAA